MSWVSKGLKKVRKAAGLPPLTLRTAAKTALPYVPVVGPTLAAAAGALDKKSASKDYKAVAKTAVEAGFDSLAQKAAVARQGAQVYGTVSKAGEAVTGVLANPLALVAIGGLAFVLMGRGRR